MHTMQTKVYINFWTTDYRRVWGGVCLMVGETSVCRVAGSNPQPLGLIWVVEERGGGERRFTIITSPKSNAECNVMLWIKLLGVLMPR